MLTYANTCSTTLPRLGSRVRISSPAPVEIAKAINRLRQGDPRGIAHPNFPAATIPLPNGLGLSFSAHLRFALAAMKRVEIRCDYVTPKAT